MHYCDTRAANGPVAGLLPTSARIGAYARRIRVVALLVLLPALLAACGGTWKTEYGDPLDRAVTSNWRVSQVNVSVPETLTVSDENVYFPRADIVWHGDPPGDRRAQAQKIVRDSARTATAPMRGGRPVAMNLTVREFHGISPITLAKAPSAVYNMAFDAQIVDARTGVALTPPTQIHADVPALVGEAGIAAAQFGPTQKEQVTGHLVAVFQGWLGIGPDVRGTFSSFGR